MTPAPTTDDDAIDDDATDDDPDAGGPLEDADRVQRALLWAGIGLLALLATVATYRVYAGASRAIARFVAPEFQPVFEAAFNLAVLLLAVAGIGLLLRRLEATT